MGLKKRLIQSSPGIVINNVFSSVFIHAAMKAPRPASYAVLRYSPIAKQLSVQPGGHRVQQVIKPSNHLKTQVQSLCVPAVDTVTQS